ncbi:MAG TPA: sulfite exporter TauE/SafE family protein [Luteitalea sp.]|nr:sulfite exporter TauE/SafE family protein [Luteitalea sp.]
MTSFLPGDAATLAVAALLIGFSKGGLGGPLPTMMATLLLSQRASVATAVALATPMLMVGDAFALYTYWGTWDREHSRALVPAGMVGCIIGLFLLRGLPDRSLRVGLGVAGLIVVGYKIHSHWRGREHYVRQPWHAPLAGLLSGISSGMLNAGGPPITSYLLLQPITPIVFMGTNTIFFAIVNLLKVPGSLAAGVVTGKALAWSLAFCPLVAIGVFLGRYFIARVDAKMFDRIMTAILIFACGWLIATAYL